jgi:hypothetical protein
MDGNMRPEQAKPNPWKKKKYIMAKERDEENKRVRK